jgi:hypothetical protein
MPSPNLIISRVLASSGCSRLLTADGITTQELSMKGLQGIFESTSVDAKAARKTVPSIGQAASIAKNLDEYQFLICSLVPSLPDSDSSKMQLQKYRVVIVAAFAQLARNLKENRLEEDLEQWNRHARLLLEDTSNGYVKAKSNAKLQIVGHKEIFDFFGMPEDTIDEALRAYYGQ